MKFDFQFRFLIAVANHCVLDISLQQLYMYVKMEVFDSVFPYQASKDETSMLESTII